MRDDAEWRPYVRPIRPDLRADVDAEFAFHLEMLAQELAAAGMHSTAARAEAERRFGERAHARDACLDIDRRRLRRNSWRDLMSALWQDLRLALRSMRKQPGFALVVTLTLALGIGAATAMFAVVDGVLLRKLPYPDSDRLVMLFNSGERSAENIPLSYPDYLDLVQRGTPVFSQVSGWIGTGEQIAAAGGEAELLQGNRVSANLPELLGVKPVVGRTFLPEEELPSGRRVVMISEAFWRSRFHADRAAIGTTLTMSGLPYTIIGVFPSTAAARLPTDLQNDRVSSFWIPLRFSVANEPRGFNFMDVAGRLRPDLTPAQARTRLALVVSSLKKDGVDLAGLHLAPLASTVIGNVDRPLVILLVAVALLLLISCANVANLLLARAAVRQRELGIRAAIGAGRARIVVQLLAESLVQAVIGGAAGVALAVGLTAAAKRWVSLTLPRFDTVHVDARVLGVAAAVSLLAGLVFGVVPAFRAASTDLTSALREGGRGLMGSVSRDRFRRALVVIEVALSFVLLAGAGLLVRSLDALLAVKPGFDPTHVTTAQVGLPGVRYPDSTAIRAFYQRLLRDVRTLPGVESVALVSDLPGLGGTYGDVSVAGVMSTPQNPLTADKRIVSVGYFQTLNAHLAAGRFFEAGDAGGPPAVIVNRTFADRYFHGRDAIGQRAGFMWDTKGDETIVGVVDDIREGRPDQPALPAIYIPADQRPDAWMHLVVRSRLDQATVVRGVRAKLAAIDPELALSSIESLEVYLSGGVDSRRQPATILGAFAALAALLAAVGLYGVMSYSVAQRTQEFGIRAALGAQRADQLRLVMLQGGAFVVAGLVLGAGLAVGTTRFMASQLYAVGPTDALTFAAVAGLLAAVSALALVVPSVRATRADPIEALRAE